MSERFSGLLHSSFDIPPAAALPPGMARIDFAHGCFGHRTELSVFHEHGDVCLGLGTPRFLDAPLEELNQRRGPASAWMRAFHDHGETALERVHGRFSVLLIRDNGNEAWLATDRFGTWPVCYALSNGSLYFSDRADRVPGGRRPISAQAVFDYLFFHMIPAPVTIFEGVSRLPAGHLLKWTRGEAECTPWWRPVFDESARPDLADSRQRFLQIIEEDVRREAEIGVEGVEVGAFLSGGTDSSTVSGMLCKVLGKPARTYSIGFDAAGYDEMAYARIAAKHFGTDHHEYYVTPEDLLDGIPRVATHYDQPFGNSSAVPAWICVSRARDEGITKMLAGDGGDELFGGNTRYAKQRIFGAYDKVPGVLRRSLLQPVFSLPGMNHIPGLKKGASYIEQARVPMPDRMQMYNMLLRLGLDTVFAPDFLARVDAEQPFAMQRQTWKEAQASEQINQLLAYDWKYTLADNDLPKVIGTTELAGVDVAFPLLSDELLDFSLGIPAEWKLKGLTLRWFFKDALRGFLPDEIIAKKKHGFGLPFGVWACKHDGLKSLAVDALSTMRERGIVRPEFIDELLDIHLPAHPGYYGEMVWILMIMEFWLRAHEGGETITL